jgi:hypothetical protein
MIMMPLATAAVSKRMRLLSTLIVVLVLLSSPPRVESFAPSARPKTVLQHSSRTTLYAQQTGEPGIATADAFNPNSRSPRRNLFQRIRNPLRRHNKKRTRVLAAALAALAWWKGPNACTEAAHAISILHSTTPPAILEATTEAPSAVFPGSPKLKSTRVATGAGSVLLVVLGGDVVRRKVIRNSPGNSTTATDTLLEEDPLLPGEIEYAQLKLEDPLLPGETEYAQLKLEDDQEQVKHAQKRVEGILDRVKEAQRKANEVVENAIVTKAPEPQVVPVVSVPVKPVSVAPAAIKTPAAQKKPVVKISKLPLKNPKYTKARQQPKAPTEEEQLKQKYASIDSLEERAFQVLVDLGMVETTD